MKEADLMQLSKTVSHALRHEPQYYDLQLDNQGWVLISDLVIALRTKGFNVDENSIIEMANLSAKKRHQISEGKIRAFYGHSTEKKIIKEPSEPPLFLYHGTIQDNLQSIQKDGLLPMGRQYVHLSVDNETAQIVAKRRKGEIVILTIKAREAHINNIQFYQEENGIWLSDPIPSKYIIY